MRGRKHESTRCSVDGCATAPKAHGYCDKHYRRWQRNGDPNAVTVLRGMTDDTRFWHHVDKSAPCWLWTSEIVRGYGRFKRSDGSRVMAHRYAYELAHDAIPAGLTLDHLCNEPRCVNPVHLEPVTIQENIRRRDERRRSA